MKTILVIQNDTLQLSRSICLGIYKYVRINKQHWKIKRYSAGWKSTQNYEFLHWEDIDGSIVSITSKEQMSAITHPTKFPMVITCAEYKAPLFTQVDANSYRIGKMAAEYFIQKGFRSFLCIEETGSMGRCTGFQKTLQALGFITPRFSMEGFSTESPSGSAILKKTVECLQKMPRPIALYVESDGLAIVVIEALQEHGFHIPNDIAVLGTEDDILICESAVPHISSIRLPYEEVGYEAARNLDILLRGGTPPSEPILLDPQGITERQSTNILAVPDPHIQKAILYIKKNAYGPITVAEVARASGLSLRVLQTQFKNALGYSLQKEISRIRVIRVKELLQNSTLSLDEITEQIGYSNQSHLSNTFRAATGITPGNYRKQFKT